MRRLGPLVLVAALAPSPALAEEADPCTSVPARFGRGCRMIVEAVRSDDPARLVAMLSPHRPLVRIDRYAAAGRQTARYRDPAALAAALGPSLRGWLHLGPAADDRIRAVGHVARPGDCVRSFLRVEIRNGASFASLALADEEHVSLIITRPR